MYTKEKTLAVFTRVGVDGLVFAIRRLFPLLHGGNDSSASAWKSYDGLHAPRINEVLRLVRNSTRLLHKTSKF